MHKARISDNRSSSVSAAAAASSAPAVVQTMSKLSGKKSMDGSVGTNIIVRASLPCTRELALHACAPPTTGTWQQQLHVVDRRRGRGRLLSSSSYTSESPL